MNELERMKAGYWLHAVCPSIGAELLRGEELCFRLNQLPPSRHEEREAILRDLFGHLGEGCTLHSPFHCDFGTQIRIGDGFVGNFNLTILDEAPVTIGDRVLIGPNVGIYTVSHALQPDQRAEGIMRSLPVRIGNDVWIGGHVVITQGVTIGDGAVIGAGSVVTHDIPARVIAAGNPCRVLRPITEEDRIREVY
ncbi:sugar O-acetyltransferase [uncultured Alistipes sp.]|uniref:sugar O-acetyltransferase n=1 Tax=uncultured Alistipes sp. TaxID=538949 RepID=UPI00262BA37A|nr:sugar O-acetyltransferase [uncultured Alistipes sp.]